MLDEHFDRLGLGSHVAELARGDARPENGGCERTTISVWSTRRATRHDLRPNTTPRLAGVILFSLLARCTLLRVRSLTFEGGERVKTRLTDADAGSKSVR